MRKRFVDCVVMPFLVCAVLLVASVPAARLGAAVTPAQAIQTRTSEQPLENSFTGKILSQNGVRFILRDETNDVWYHLDDQQEAGKFLGKHVLVTGVLDGFTDTIRVHSIVESKS